MEELSVMDRLSEKVSQILQQYHELQSENEVLQGEMVSLREENEVYVSQVTQLEEEIAGKEQEIEEIVNKIESILG